MAQRNQIQVYRNSSYLCRTMSPNKKQRSLLSSLREELSRNDVDAFIVGSGDAHQSEYVCKSDMRRQFITGFSGSAGTALILKDKALLWTDGRYFLQAKMELSEDWTLMKSGEPSVLDMNDWLVANMKKDENVGVDASLISTEQAKKIAAILGPHGIILKAMKSNPVDTVWNAEGSRPPFPCGLVEVHDISVAGIEHKMKIQTLQERIRAVKATSMIVSMLDEVRSIIELLSG